MTQINDSLSTRGIVATKTSSEINLTKEVQLSGTKTNAYTDAEQTKVGHITVTQAVDLDTIESGLATNTSKLSGIEAGATADQTDAEILAAIESESGRVLSDDATKLDGIEASADVTDATNVESAGAVMAVANPINDVLCVIPFKNSLAMLQGVGAVTFNRASLATHVDRYGVVQDLANGETGYDANGIYLPPASTNLQIYSNDLSDSTYNKYYSVISAGAAAPTAAGDATNRITADGTANQHRFKSDITVTQGDIYTTSVVVKGGTARYIRVSIYHGTGDLLQMAFDLQNGVTTATPDNTNLIDFNVLPLVDDWYLLSLTGSNESDTNTAISIYILDEENGENVSSASGYIDVYNVQFEALPFPTSPIITEASAVTRLGATAEIDYAENFPGSLKDKTVIMDVDIIGTTAANATVFDSGDLKMRVSGSAANDGECSVFMATGSETTPLVTATSFRFGMTYDAENTTLKMFADGVKVGEDTTATSAGTALTDIVFGSADAYVKVKNEVILDVCYTDQQMGVA